MVKNRPYVERVMDIMPAKLMPVKVRPQFASALAASKMATAAANHAQAVQERRDRIAKTVTGTTDVDQSRRNLASTKTYGADDTLVHTEAQKLRGGRLDLIA